MTEHNHDDIYEDLDRAFRKIRGLEKLTFRIQSKLQDKENDIYRLENDIRNLQTYIGNLER